MRTSSIRSAASTWPPTTPAATSTMRSPASSCALPTELSLSVPGAGRRSHESVAPVYIASAQALWDGRPGWLNTASYGLPPRPGWEALQAALAQWRQGTGAWEEWQSVTVQVRASFARLLGVAPDQVFSGSTVSAALGLVAGTVPDG